MLEWQNVAEMATQPEDGNAVGEWHTTEHLALAAASLGTAILGSLRAHPPALVRGTVGERGCACHSRKWECIASALVVSLYQKFYHPYILQWTKPTTEKSH